MLQISPNLLKYFKNFCSSPSIIMLFVYLKSRFSLSYRELEEMMIMRGANIDHSTLQRWVKRFTRLIDTRVRCRKKPVKGSWCIDETYIKLNGKWVYLYRAVDKEGNTIDFLLRAKRDAIAAKAFFRKAFKQHGRPDKVTVDKSGSNKAALDACNEEMELWYLQSIFALCLKYLKIHDFLYFFQHSPPKLCETCQAIPISNRPGYIILSPMSYLENLIMPFSPYMEE